jgi:cytochrome c
MRKVNFLKNGLITFVAACAAILLFAFSTSKNNPPTSISNIDIHTNADTLKKPEDDRFVKTVLYNDLNEPIDLVVADDGRVFFVERAGNFYVYTPSDKKTTLVYKFPVGGFDKLKQGMLGITLAPDFNTNNQIYFFFSTVVNDVNKTHLSRFTISKNNELDLTSEKVVLEAPLDAERSAHSGGSMAWDKNKNLFLSIGDNTIPSQSEGYAPIDRRAGRIIYDAERTAGNTNDLRGKILRIHPEADGTYTIPEGNLFPKGTPLTRPEIYVMGCRNPYRLTVDQETNILYWGEVGPDAGSVGPQGGIGYDEFNQAKKAGFYGWPFFVGNNQPYNEYDFATRVAGKPFDVNGAENLSPNNTGAKVLPPANKAMVWYSNQRSDKFPELENGTRCIIGGPMYHYNTALTSTTKFPQYFDKTVFFADFMRNWIFGVRIDQTESYSGMTEFMKTNGDFKRPIGMKFGPEGSLYMLEYGSIYEVDNTDARLVRIDYNEGNRAPYAKITTKDTIGLIPYKATLTQKSYDYDKGDKLSYKWLLNGCTVISTTETPVYTFRKNGIYKVTLKVTDAAGKTTTDTKVIKVGNTLPQISISTIANSTFFFPGERVLRYKVAIKDKEDKIIDPKRTKIAINYIARVENGQSPEQLALASDYNYGKALIAKSDCKACHQTYTKMMGPAFIEVAKRYVATNDAVDILAAKIIKGGTGVWGELAMSAHPQLTRDDASEIVKYILTLNSVKATTALPKEGSLTLKDHVATPNDGRYILTASYTDKGGAIMPLTATKSLVLRPARVNTGDADDYVKIDKRPNGVFMGENNSYFILKNIDLKNINKLTYNYFSRNSNNKIEVHADSPAGPIISTITFAVTEGGFGRSSEQSAAIKDPGATHDLYFVFMKSPEIRRAGMALNWVNFDTK